uniref:Ovule protein n=1 Tax=Steinernema glaseri TaxID=37863 RepID=A0A1I8A5I6_9BILA
MKPTKKDIQVHSESECNDSVRAKHTTTTTLHLAGFETDTPQWSVFGHSVKISICFTFLSICLGVHLEGATDQPNIGSFRYLALFTCVQHPFPRRYILLPMLLLTK